MKKNFIFIIFAFAVFISFSNLSSLAQEVVTTDSDEPIFKQIEEKDLITSDVETLKSYWSEYLEWLRLVHDGSGNGDGYGDFGLILDKKKVDDLRARVDEINTTFQNQDFEKTKLLFKTFTSDFILFDLNVNAQIEQIDHDVAVNIIDTFFPTVDSWLKENKDLGYEVAEIEPGWQRLKDSLIEVKGLMDASRQGNLDSQSPNLQQQLYDWYPLYEEWAKKAEAEFDRQYKEDQEASPSAESIK